MFKQYLYVPYHAHNKEYMYIVSDGGDFMENMSEYMEVWKRDRIMFSHFQLWCRKGAIYGYFKMLGFSDKMEWVFMD